MTTVKEDKILNLVNRALNALAISPVTSLVNNPTSEIVESVNLILKPAIDRVLTTFAFTWSYKITPLVQYNDDHKGYQLPADFLTYLGIGTADRCYCGCSSNNNFKLYSHKFIISRVAKQLDVTRPPETRLYIDSCCLASGCYQYFHYIGYDNDYNQLASYPHLEEYIVYEIADTLAPKLARSNDIIALIRKRRDDERALACKHETVNYGNEPEQCRNIPFYTPYDPVKLY